MDDWFCVTQDPRREAHSVHRETVAFSHLAPLRAPQENLFLLTSTYHG